MAGCTRHSCGRLLNAVVSGTKESSTVCMGRVSLCRKSPNVINRSAVLPSRGLCSISGNRIQKGQQLQSVKTLGSSNFVRYYSSEETETDFSRGYGGPIRMPVIDWRDKHCLDYKTFSAKVEKANIQLIDVREPFEIESAGCIERSINISCVHFRSALLLSPADFSKKYNKNQPKKDDDNIVIVDLRGNRSEGALRISHELGFTKVKRFPGGFREWSAKNDLPVPPTYYEHGIPRDHWTNLKYDDMLMMIKRPDVYVVDVREPWEVVEQGSITNALNIPMGYLELALNMDEAEFEAQYERKKPTKNSDIGFISWKGLRSAGCQLLAQELGYVKACNLVGGQEGYNAKKSESERPDRSGSQVHRSADDVYQ